VDDTASTPPPDIDDALEGDTPTDEADDLTSAEDTPPAEPRGPHAPDRWPVLVFIGLAILAAWATYPNPPSWTVESFLAFVLDLMPTVCPVLLPAALLLRHPDAPRVARPLFFGTLLLAAVPFFKLAGPPLEVFFNGLTPPPADLDWFVPSSILYGYFHSLLSLFGVLYLAVGLSRARHWAYRPSARAAGSVVLALGVLTSLATIYSFTQADLSGVELTPPLWAYLIGSIVLGVLTILTWTYLAVTVVRCSLSGEEPGLGWSSAALGTTLIVVTFAIGAWANLVQTPNEAISNLVFWLSNATYSFGFLLLLIGFLLGMPSLEPVDWAEDDTDLEGDGSAEDGDDEEGDDSEEEGGPDESVAARAGEPAA